MALGVEILYVKNRFRPWPAVHLYACSCLKLQLCVRVCEWECKNCIVHLLCLLDIMIICKVSQFLAFFRFKHTVQNERILNIIIRKEFTNWTSSLNQTKICFI